MKTHAKRMKTKKDYRQKKKRMVVTQRGKKMKKKANKPNTKQMKTQDTFELPEVDIFMTFSDISLEIV